MILWGIVKKITSFNPQDHFVLLNQRIDEARHLPLPKLQLYLDL